MRRMSPPRSFRLPRLSGGGTLALPAILALGLILSGCSTDMTSTGSLGRGAAAPALPRSEAALREYATEWGRRHDANPDDKTAALNYARALRGLTQYAQSAAVLEAIAVKHPYDRDVLGAYGKALADAGRLREAADVLTRAHTPERPDWSVLSAQGSVADQLGEHADALNYYQAALKIAPGEPSVLSNLGLSYALAQRLPEAEAALRQAADNPRADMRIRQNLALVLALAGKFQDAEAVARHDLAPADAAASIATIRQMIAQTDTWHTIQSLNGRGKGLKPLKAAPPPGDPTRLQ